jgi:predicted  nucleic acid-binding Zn-ribbon protein
MTWLEKNMEHHLAVDQEEDDVEELLTTAADIMRRHHEKKAEAEAEARTLASHAKEEMKILDQLLQEAETARISLEMELKKTKARLEESEGLFETRLVMLQQERSALELCAQAAENRAKTAEENLVRLKAGFRALMKRYEEGREKSSSNEESIVSPSTAPLEEVEEGVPVDNSEAVRSPAVKRSIPPRRASKKGDISS